MQTDTRDQFEVTVLGDNFKVSLLFKRHPTQLEVAEALKEHFESDGWFMLDDEKSAYERLLNTTHHEFPCLTLNDGSGYASYITNHGTVGVFVAKRKICWNHGYNQQVAMTESDLLSFLKGRKKETKDRCLDWCRDNRNLIRSMAYREDVQEVYMAMRLLKENKLIK